MEWIIGIAGVGAAWAVSAWYRRFRRAFEEGLRNAEAAMRAQFSDAVPRPHRIEVSTCYGYPHCVVLLSGPEEERAARNGPLGASMDAFFLQLVRQEAGFGRHVRRTFKTGYGVKFCSDVEVFNWLVRGGELTAKSGKWVWTPTRAKK